MVKLDFFFLTCQLVNSIFNWEESFGVCMCRWVILPSHAQETEIAACQTLKWERPLLAHLQNIDYPHEVHLGVARLLEGVASAAAFARCRRLVVVDVGAETAAEELKRRLLEHVMTQTSILTCA